VTEDMASKQQKAEFPERQAMNSKYFSFTDVLGYGWHVMAANFWFFVGIGSVWLLITLLPTFAEMALDHLPLSKPVYVILKIATNLAGSIIGIVLGIGIIKIALSFCDEQKPVFTTLFDARDCFWRYLGTAILYTLIVIGGCFLLFIPGIIWAVKFGLCFYFVVDKGLDPVQALKASSRTTMGVKGELFALGIIKIMIIYLGILCFLMGLFAAYPIVIVASALVYRQLLAQTPDLAEFGIPVTSPQPPGGPLPGEQVF